MIKYSVDLSRFRWWVENSKNEIWDLIDDVVKEAINDIYRDIQENHPVDTWKTKRTIEKNISRRSPTITEWEIIWPTDISNFLEEGTKAHRIKPVKAVALRFKVNWKFVHSKWHIVTWIKPYKIFENAFRRYINSYDLENNLSSKIRKITW